MILSEFKCDRCDKPAIRVTLPVSKSPIERADLDLCWNCMTRFACCLFDRLEWSEERKNLVQQFKKGNII
jgi:hypothetical protein